MGATLQRGADTSAAVELLAARAGGRVGLDGVLADLRREARPFAPRPKKLELAVTWDDADRRDRVWWPQGVTGSWDVSPGADGHVLLTTAYAKPVGDVRLGSRITVHDVGDPARVRYDHVLLVHARTDADGALEVSPVHAHAGGAAWVGNRLHVAATARGFHTFDPDDVVVAAAVGDVGLPEHGHRYLLPTRTTYHSRTPEGEEPLRYSFLSVVHEPGPTVPSCRLLVGEYGHGAMTTRLWTHDLDPATGLPVTDEHGTARPSFLRTSGVERMQGAVLAGGRLHVVTSRGRHRRGSVWTERGDRLVEHEHVLPPGPEDLSHRPSTDELWSLTEYPCRRMVVAVDRGRLG